VLTTILMVVLLAVVAFAVDLGYILHARTELQRTADACALAAARRLPDQAEAEAAARRVAEENLGSSGTDLDLSGIEFGYWDRDEATFTSPPPYGWSPNAVRVTLDKSGSRGNPLDLFFARVLGTSTADLSASATALYDRWLCGPFVGILWLSVPGTPNTDSYDSREGSYHWSLARDRGSICSDGPIHIDGTALIRGDARAGKGYHVIMTGNTEVTGSIGSRLKPLNLPYVDASQAAVENDNGQVPLIPEGNSWKSPIDAAGNFVLDGNRSIELPPGTYYFHDFILTGHARFDVSGHVTIYVTGDFERAGTTIVNNNTQKPANLTILMTGGRADVTSGNDFHGVIYAPNTEVTIDGSADLYGAVVGRTLTITGSGAGHYDESLDLETVRFPKRTALVD
jgi:Flp pilus assembly protein TadG